MQLNPENGQLAARTDAGGLFGLEFDDFDGTRFKRLVIPNLIEVGWQTLTRVP